MITLALTVAFGTATLPRVEAIQTIGVTVSFKTVAVTGGGGGGGTWGSITGTLSNQTDLQNALDEKATVLALNAHTGDTNNPHNVTKAQVGLSNVDNTSDINKPISTATQTALDAKADKALTINAQTDNYQIVLTDAGKLVSISAATAKNLTVPLNSSVAFPIGTQILVYQLGAGQITVNPSGGVTLHSANGALKTRVQYSTIALIKTATDTWLVSGDTNV